MSIEFRSVDNVANAMRAERFDRARVVSGGPFVWHRWAPGPVYRLCVVQIIAINTPSQIRVRCFDRSAQLVGSSFDVDLHDWTQVWAAAPSTIELPVDGNLGGRDCAVLCLSDSVLAGNHLNLHEVSITKYPYAEDAEDEIMRLKMALTALGGHIPAEVFQHALASHGIRATELAA